MIAPTRHTLENGMRIIVAEDHAVPVVAAAFWTSAGVCEEPPGRRGIAHFLEHMMFRGSANVAPEEHARTIARLGGDSNAHTAPDVTVFHETVPAGVLEEVFRLEADRFQHLKVTTEHTDIERKVILEELRVYENQPAARAMIAVQKQISGEHPYALSPLGRREDLEAMSAEDLSGFHQQYYQPSRVVAVVCGDVDTPHVRELAEKYFGSWRAPSENGARPAAVYRPRVGSLSLKLPFEVPVMVQIYRTDPLSEVDKPALDLLVALLSSGTSSPIREALVREKRLCVEAACMPLVLARGGLLVFFGVFLPPGRHAPRRAILSGLIDRIVEQGPDPDHFARHLKRFRVERAHDRYSQDDRALGLGNAELLEGGFEEYTRGYEELSKVTPQRVQALAGTLFAGENRLELDITPQRTKWWLVPVGVFSRLWPR